MADEFNPQGVDQTPRNNENPNSTADTGNAEPKNPFVGGDSVDAGNASDSSEQQAPVSSAALAADQQPTQAATDTAATEPIPDYASAKGESTVCLLYTSNAFSLRTSSTVLSVGLILVTMPTGLWSPSSVSTKRVSNSYV